jgi:hypothetical protein
MSSPGFAFMAFCSASAILATAPHVAGMTDVLRDVFHAFAGWGALVFFRAPKMGCHEQNGVCWHWVYHYSRCYEKVWVRVEPYPDNGYLKPSWNRCFFASTSIFICWSDSHLLQRPSPFCGLIWHTHRLWFYHHNHSKPWNFWDIFQFLCCFW